MKVVMLSYSLNIGEGGGVERSGRVEEESHSHLLNHSQAPTKLQALSQVPGS